MKFRDLYWFLSNMYPAKVPMNIGGEDFIFDNAEAAFQAQKNPSLAKLFVGLNGFDAKRQGRKVPITTPDWNTARLDAMRKAVQAKFDNNPDIMKMLTDTDTQYLVEDNDWGDTFWGMSGGQGKNMLGNILMDVRDQAIANSTKGAIADTVTDLTPTPVDDVVAEVATNPNFHALGQDIITKVISGGQTGADILGLQLAQQAGIPTGGTMSYGPNGELLTEFDDGIDRSQFGFDILDFPGSIRDAYVNRTNLNAANADGTVYFRGPEQGNGWFATQRAAKSAGKPFLDNPQSANDIINWALQNNVKTLNIAGNRGSKMTPDVKNNMSRVLNDLFANLQNQVGVQTVEGSMLDTTDPYAIQQVNTLGTMVAPELKKLYTSYFGNNETNILPINVPVSIGMGKANQILGDKIDNFDVNNPLRKLVAPDYNNILRPYQLDHNVDAYTEKYLNQLNSNKDDILAQAAKLPAGTILDCYEQPGDFCHRNILADWFNQNGAFDVSEWQNGQTHLDPTTIEGNLLDTDIPLVMQQVNNRGVMGKGLAEQIRNDLSDEEFAKYRKYAHGDPAMMGKTLVLPSKTHPNRKYLNIFGQDMYGGYLNPKTGIREPYNKVFTDMNALEQAFTNIANKYPPNTPIAMPTHFGSGNANGNWEEIEALADRILGSKLNLFKYNLPNSNKYHR